MQQDSNDGFEFDLRSGHGSICPARHNRHLGGHRPIEWQCIGNSPPGPSTCVSPDTVNFTGNVHVVAQVDTVANTVDVHINLMTVKGTGQNGKYIGNGATSMLSLPAGISPGPINFAADLHPPNPCRAGFTSQGALQITVRLTFAADNTLATVSAVAGTAGN